jgi:hypothetical protein
MGGGGVRGLTRRPEKLVEAGSTSWTVLEDTVPGHSN